MGCACCAPSAWSASRARSASGSRRACIGWGSSESRVRIAFITPTYGAHGGGAGRLIQQLARHIERGGDSIEIVLHTTPETAFAEEARKDGMVVRPFRPRINGV